MGTSDPPQWLSAPPDHRRLGSSVASMAKTRSIVRITSPQLRSKISGKTVKSLPTSAPRLTLIKPATFFWRMLSRPRAARVAGGRRPLVAARHPQAMFAGGVI